MWGGVGKPPSVVRRTDWAKRGERWGKLGFVGSELLAALFPNNLRREGEAMRIHQKVTELCASENNKEAVRELMAIILANIRETDEHISRRAFYIAVGIVGFELVKRASVTEITVAGIQITEFSIAERVLPAVIAYLNLACWGLVASRRLLENLYDAFIKCLYPDLWERDLELYLRPSYFIKTYDIVSRLSSGFLKVTLRGSMAVIVVVVAFAVPSFSIYAIYSTLNKYGTTDILTLVSAAVTLFFVIQMFVIMSGSDSAIKDAEVQGSV